MGNGLAAELVHCVSRRPLLGLLLISSPGRRIAAAADLRGDLEALAVVRALLVEQLVGGRRAQLPLASCWSIDL